MLMIALVAASGCKKNEEIAPTHAASAAPGSANPVAKALQPPPGPFEGEITMTVKADAAQKLPTSFTYDIKGDKVRYSPTAAQARTLGDVAALRAVVVEDTHKTYQEVDVHPSTDKAKAPSEPKVTKSGKTEKLAGLDCEDWTIEDGAAKVEACVAKGVSFLDLAREPKPGSSEPGWAATLTKEKSFPLRVVVHDKAGKEQYRAEATRVDRKPLDGALFDVPKDYKKGDLTEQMKTVSLP
jgi:hypothetical protein